MKRLPALIAWLWCLPLAATAQTAPADLVAIQLGSHDDRLAPTDYYRFRDLHYGRRPIQDGDSAETKLNQDVLQKAARWYAYRLTWSAYQSGRDEIGMSDLVQDACRQVPLATARRPLTADQVRFQEVFGAALRQCLQEVLRDRQPIVRINATRILAHLAAAGQTAAAALLLGMIQDERESDAVRLFAFRGLKDLFAAHGAAKASAALRMRAVPVLLAYVQQAPKLAASAPAAEIDGYRYVRREAFRALIASRPAAPPANDQLDRATVAALLGALGGDRYQPAPSLSEQLEAAVAVCGLTPPTYAAGELELAAHHAGQFVVDLARHVQLAAENRSPANLPWKLAAVRLSVALAALQGKLGATPAAERVGPLLDEALAILTQVEKGENPHPAELSRWLQRHPPPVSALSRLAGEMTLAAPAPGQP